MNITLRDATEKDFNFVFELNKTNMRKYVEETREWDDEKEKEDLKSKFSPELDKIIQIDRKDVGVLRAIDKGDELSLDHIELLSEHQRKGIGTQLIKSLINSGKKISLKVRKNNPAVKLYQRLGFSIRGEGELKYFMSTK
jgi:ribosomal protein S18 acetylase RimI-like enzyme